MTTNEILNSILNIPGAAMGRANKTNFIVIPSDEGFVKVSVTSALMKDTKNHKAFDANAAVQEYEAWAVMNAEREAKRAANPPRAKGPNPEAQARRDALDAAITAMPAFADYTATDIYNALPDKAENLTVMAVGSAARRLVEAGVLAMDLDEKKKPHYTKG